MLPSLRTAGMGSSGPPFLVRCWIRKGGLVGGNAPHMFNGWDPAHPPTNKHGTRTGLDPGPDIPSKYKEPLPDPPPARRKGWCLRSGEIAELCDRCSCTFEQGNFCETYHSDDGGWRNCEACGKRVHCGCIVSVTAYVLLDAGGVDCVACATKPSAMAPNQMISSPMLVSPLVTERREFPAKSWKSVNGPVFGQWRQASRMWNMTSAQSDLQQRLSYEFDRPNTTEKFSSGGHFSVLAHEKKI